MKELKSLKQDTLPGIELLGNSEDLEQFEFEIIVSSKIYTDPFKLIVRITNDYPVQPPQVKFLQDEDHLIPLHPHIYSNGHICLNLLGKDWTPACSIESILLSIQSMLATNETLERPPDDKQYVAGAPAYASSTGFYYHDDNV